MTKLGGKIGTKGSYEMTFEDYAKDRLISKPGTVSYMEAHAAWRAACKQVLERAMAAILEECPSDGSDAEIILRRAWDRVRLLPSD